MFPPEIREAIRHSLNDRKNIDEMFSIIKVNYDQRIKEFADLLNDDTKPSEERFGSFIIQTVYKESLKNIEVLEMAFLNHSFTYRRLIEITEIVSKMNVESEEIKKKIQIIQDEIKHNEELDRKSMNLLEKFPFSMSSFEVNTGIFKANFDRKKKSTSET